jgi:tetratricopeptide (TPR) repeat protein
MAKKYELRRRERRESLAGEKTSRGGARPSREQRGKAEAEPTPAGRKAGRGVVLSICGLLVLGSALIYVQTARYEFVNCDDNEYIYENTAIQQGPNWQCAWRAITNPHSANWHPLTWLSHAVDWRLFGKWSPELDRYVDSWPGGHHLVNLGIHAACAALLYLVLQAMTGATWPSAAVAAVFAVHPLHVESVAWATGRKDTLSALFFLLTLAAYHAYATREFSWWRYALVVASFALGLMSKPMLVSVPFVLLLLDNWPLRRIVLLDGPRATFNVHVPARVILEKLPLLGLSAGSCYLTTWAQASVGAFKPLDFPYRLANAVISYAAFIVQMLWPAGMVVQYVHRGPSLRVEDTLLPLALLAPITLAAFWFGRRRRYLLVGWLWYIGMLVPVIGLVQVGAQARADRYTYLTQIGLCIMIAWGLNDLGRKWRWRAALYSAAAAAVLAALAAVAWRQTAYWQNSFTLWEHSVACQPDNDFALNSYADALNAAGQPDEANKYYLLSFAKNPKYLTPLCSLAGNLYKHHKAAEALAVCNEGLLAAPNDSKMHFLKAVALYGTGKVDESVREFRVAIAMNPNTENTRGDLADMHADLAEVLRLNPDQLENARKECLIALQLKPESPDAHRTLGSIMLAKGELAAAEEEFRTTLKYKPDDPLGHAGLADSLWRQGKRSEAVQEYNRAHVKVPMLPVTP